MENYEGILLIIGICFLVLAVVLFKRKAEIFVNFILRSVMGTLGFYFLNQVFASQGICTTMGINPATICTVGCLGISGFIMLYVILFYHTLL